MILRNAMFAGMTRFTDFQRSLSIAPNILSNRLETFVREGIMTASKGDFEYLEYHLTSKGLDFLPVLFALREWGDRWAAPEGAPVVVTHKECGGKLEQKLSCKKCGASPKLKDIVAESTNAFEAYVKKLETPARKNR